jgi:predicted helicase
MITGKVNGKPLGEVKVWLRDDYVKFIRFGEQALESVGIGILGYITNNSFFDGLTFRGMRHHLLSNCTYGYFLNLHGNGNLKERAPDGSLDENVFDILQGVGITLLIKHSLRSSALLAFCADIFGTREAKYKRLKTAGVSSSDFIALTPKPPNYFVIEQNEEGYAEYEQFISIPALFEIGGLGFQSHRDNFVAAFSADEVAERMKMFFDLRFSDKDIKERFGIDDYRRFVVGQFRRANKFEKSSICRLQYRPFDYRYIYYARDIIQEWQIRFHGHLLKPNFGLNVMRQTKAVTWQHVMVSQTPTPAVFVEIKDGSSQFPLYRYSDFDASLFATKAGRVPNLSEHLIREWFGKMNVSPTWLSDKSKATENATPEDIFHYTYAVFHSPGYRRRYTEFLKIDFPRLPLTSSLDLFRSLSRLGSELVALHLMESPKLDKHLWTKFVGSRNPEVEKVSWSRDTVWLDKAQTIGFAGVPENVWNFHIGGYQVCEKWLKDRKGRILSKDDIRHYAK